MQMALIEKEHFMKSRNSLANSALAAAAFVFLWAYLWLPFGRAAHDAFFNYFYDTRVPPQIFPANPLLAVAFFLVLGHALGSPIVWIILGRVFRSRAGTLAASGISAYLFQIILIFFASGERMWLNDPNASIFGLWGLVIYFLVLGANLVAAVLAPLVMFFVARSANKRAENKSNQIQE